MFFIARCVVFFLNRVGSFISHRYYSLLFLYAIILKLVLFGPRCPLPHLKLFFLFFERKENKKKFRILFHIIYLVVASLAIQ